MNKESIYQIIGYNGEYNVHVKKAIKKLLKENHPDTGGDRKIFELVNEVKKELEENKVSFKMKSNNKKRFLDDIDYDYCIEMLEKLEKERNVSHKKLDKMREELANDVSEYTDYYHDSINLETYLLSNSYYLEKLKRIKVYSVFLLILATIMFIVSVITGNLIFLGGFILLTFICIALVSRAFYIIQDITNNNHIKIKSYVDVNSKIRRNQNNQKVIKKQIIELEKKINNMDNDIRFYNNLINNR